jgi:hypothetical protein
LLKTKSDRKSSETELDRSEKEGMMLAPTSELIGAASSLLVSSQRGWSARDARKSADLSAIEKEDDCRCLIVCDTKRKSTRRTPLKTDAEEKPRYRNSVHNGQNGTRDGIDKPVASEAHAITTVVSVAA